MLTPAGIQELKDKGRFETAEVMEQKRQELIAESKAASASVNNSKTLSGKAAGAYFEPNEHEARILNKYYDVDQDDTDAMNEEYGMEADYYLINFYSWNEARDARMATTNMVDKYDDTRKKAESAYLSGDKNTARGLMNTWNAVRSRHLALDISEEANVDPRQTYEVLRSWDTDRDSILQESDAAFGGASRYDPSSPTHRVLAAQYHRTQRYLADQGMDTVRVYRTSNSPVTGMQSFTLESPAAKIKEGGDEVYYADIPDTRVLSLPQTGMGSVVEREILVSADTDTEWKSSTYTVDNPTGKSGGYHQ